MSLACRIYGLKPIEALGAATVNSAFAVGLGDRVGRLNPGARADAVILEGELDQLTYRPDVDHVLAVICGGELVYLAPRAAERLS
jgi:imidazolonepropionase